MKINSRGRPAPFHAPQTNSAVRADIPGRKWVMAIDLAKCDGCGKCTKACQKMHFYRLTPAANLRWSDWDVLFAGSFGHEDNWSLTPIEEEAEFSGFSMVGQYWGFDTAQGPIVPGFMYDYITVSDGPYSAEALERRIVTLALSWFPRENVRIAAYGDIDLLDTDRLHPEKLHRAFVNIRAMF